MGTAEKSHLFKVYHPKQVPGESIKEETRGPEHWASQSTSRKTLTDAFAHHFKGQMGDILGQENIGETTDTALTAYTFCW